MNGYVTESGITDMAVDMANALKRLTDVLQVICGFNGLVMNKEP